MLRKNGKQKAFTLIELILTMGILVVLASLLWPVLTGWGTGAKLDQAADDIRGLLQGARLMAIEQGAPVKLVFQPESSAYRIEGGSQQAQMQMQSQIPANAAGQPERVEFDSSGFFGQHQLQEGLRFVMPPEAQQNSGYGQSILGDQQGEYSVTFQPDGTATDAQFLIVDADEFGCNIEVRGLTGTISVGAATSVAQGGGAVTDSRNPRTQSPRSNR